MLDVVIQSSGLGKKYTIGHAARRENYIALRDIIGRGTKSFFRKISDGVRGRQIIEGDEIEEIWALQDVSFEVKRGEVMGIVGRNGAGKSTLLKILSRITDPSMGKVSIKGRVASLLEVGTGFHPELTGRENIFLNGAILGMTRLEIKENLDEIVAFAEIDRFLDTPVKRYSSGMYVRLAFAVAAHLNPEILIVDEVLAVGDASFQKKCLGKMNDSARHGRTILFVSHNMPVVSQLCSTAILLEGGRITTQGPASDVVGLYLSSASGVSTQPLVDLRNFRDRTGHQEVRYEWSELRNTQGEACREFSIGDDLIIVFELRSSDRFVNEMVKLAVVIHNSEGIPLCNMIDIDSGFQITRLRASEQISVALQDIRFYPGTYYISLWAGDMTSTEAYDFVQNCLSFEIVNGGRLTTRTLPRSAGIFFLTPTWSNFSES